MTTDKLSPFEGRPVIRAAIEIPSAAGGLREAMKFEPVEFHHEEEVYVVLRCTVAKVRFDPIKDTDSLARIHVFAAEEATFVDGEIVAEHLAAQRARLDAARQAEEARRRRESGEHSFDDEALQVEHDDGQHSSGLRRFCPSCETEAAAIRDEGGQPEYVDSDDEPTWTEDDES